MGPDVPEVGGADAAPPGAASAAHAAHAAARALGFGLALVSALGFSSLGILATLVYAEGLLPVQALAWRFAMAGGILWTWVLATGRARGLDARRFLKFSGLGVGYALQAGLFFGAVRILGPAPASLLLYTYPAFVLVLAAAFLRRRPTRVQALSLALAAAGCVLAFARPGAWPAGGVVFGVLVGAVYAAYLLVGERVMKGEDPVLATAVLMAVAAAIFAALALAGPGLPLPGGRAALGLLGIALFATLMPITTLFAAMHRIGASDASLVSTAELPATFLLSALVLAQVPDGRSLAGAGLVAAGVVLLQLGGRRRRAAAGGRGPLRPAI